MSAANITRHFKHSPSLGAARKAAEKTLPAAAMDAAYDTITQWAHYAPTPLYSVSAAAQQYGVQEIYYKDEAPRFGLDSFKALGGAYAVQSLMTQCGADNATAAANFTVSCATDGNHGRSVAWGAQRAGCHAKIFAHSGVSEARADAIRAYGAEVIRVNGNYDNSVQECARQSRQNSWRIVSDTSWPGYVETPRLVMAGYTVLMRETLQQLSAVTPPTHIILQAGVGAFAAAMIAAFVSEVATLPRIIIAESAHADCLLQSAIAGRLTRVPVTRETVMAGLSCGEPSLLAWDIISAAASDFTALSDAPAGDMMRQLADCGIVAGECASAGMGVLADSGKHSALGINKNSVVLMFGTEGATDETSYQNLTGLSVQRQ